MNKYILEEREMVREILEEAARIVEFHSEEDLEIYRDHGYHCSVRPVREHMSSGDKHLLRLMIEERMPEIPEQWRILRNAKDYALRVLFGQYYPTYFKN